MSLDTKLKDYFNDTGIQLKWFAEKLGMRRQQFYQVVSGKVPLPKKYWMKIITLTNGKITLQDLLEEKLSNIEEIEVQSSESPLRCIVSLRDFNAKT